MSFSIEVEGGASVRLATAGKYCDRDIVVTAKGVAATIEYCQTNDIVKQFVEEVTYDPADYSTSQIASYAGQSTSYDKAKPNGVVVNVPAGRLVIADTYSNIVAEKEAVAGDNVLYNLIPSESGADYVLIANGKAKQSGHLEPSGRVRMINCATSNVRDLGGWACDGGMVKYGKLFRGGEFNPEDIDIFLNQLRIRHELNLRGKAEAEEYYAQQVAAGNISLRDFVRSTIPENYVWYTIADTYKDSWREILRCVFDCAIHDEPVYFHCSAGADRTGTVACIIEAILGVSQSDIDKEYELTNFSSGVDGDSKARRRNESEWQSLINAITNLTTGSTFRDKVLNWVATLGFTVEEINDFRAAMIDGAPDTITLDIDTYTVTNTLTDVNTSNSDATVAQYQTYAAEITPEDGYIIDSVKITMGGKDVTASVWSGSETLLRYAVAKNLTNCVVSSAIGTAITAGYAYSATLVADTGYTLDGATVAVTMGGVDVSNCYANGKIFIQEVTGDIEISAEAISTEIADPFEFTSDNWTAESNATLTFAENTMQITKVTSNGVTGFAMCSTRLLRREGTYTCTVTANGTQTANNVNTLFRLFDANGTEITETGNWVPNHGYTYNTVYGVHMINSGYATFTFTLAAEVAEFQIGILPGSNIAAGDIVTINNIELVEP